MKLFKKKLLSADDISSAFKNRKHNLLAMESKGCCPGVVIRFVDKNGNKPGK